MSLIFFDLETSDKDPCGQILNYSFIRTDNNFRIQAELSGEIALSILQIPRPEALLTNRIRILDHQAKCYDSEPETMLKISRFIENSILESPEQVFLVGYNSSRFDLPYLRTSFIRNGLNPYFSGKLKYKDALHLVRKVYLYNAEFPRPFSKAEHNKLSLSLESVTKELGLLLGDQSHHSRDDVLLTIDLCQMLKEKFKVDLLSFNAYEPSSNDRLIAACSPNYEISESAERTCKSYLGLINDSYRAALWIDLERYSAGEGRAAVSWYNKNGGQLFKLPDAEIPEKFVEVHNKARVEFANLTPENFFPKSSCDIEQDIYRLDMQKISTLGRIIWDKDKSEIASIEDKDLQDLVVRYWLAYGVSADERAENWNEKLGKYAAHRYAGKTFQLFKSIPEEASEETLQHAHHCSLVQIMTSLERLLAERTDVGDREILTQLQRHILASPLWALVGSSAK